MTQEVYLLQRKLALINYALTVDSVEIQFNRQRQQRLQSAVIIYYSTIWTRATVTV